MLFMSRLINSHSCLHSHFSDEKTEAWNGRRHSSKALSVVGSRGEWLPQKHPCPLPASPPCHLTTASPSAHKLLVSRVCPWPEAQPLS